MTRLYSSFDLGKIVADEDARRDRERKDADAAARRLEIEKKRAGRSKKASANASGDTAAAPLIIPVSLQQLDLSRFCIDENESEYQLSHLHVGDDCINLAVTKELLDTGNSHTQFTWRDSRECRTVNGVVYDLLSCPEFEMIVEAAAAYHPVDADQLRLLTALKRIVEADLRSFLLSRSRVRYAAKGVDELSHDYGNTYVPSVDLKGKNVVITSTSGLDAVLGALLNTTTERYCEARTLLGVGPCSLCRLETLGDDPELQLSVGGSVGQGPSRARGVRRYRIRAV